MTRTYSAYANEEIKPLLNKLIDRGTTPEVYKEIIAELGMRLGGVILNEINSNDLASVYLACTVEDADYLAKGMLTQLEQRLKSVAFACFWNERFSPFDIKDLKVAPILRKYQEPASKNIDYLVIVKSIVSGACVVKTNLNHLIQSIEPRKIFVVAPVIYCQAEENLKNEFDRAIYDKFTFFYFAKDDERTNEGEVIPGIGGNIYNRLGFEGQEDKNRYIPEIVKSRRSQPVAKV